MTAWAAIFVAGMLAAAASDLARRRIPNALNVAIFLGGLLAQAAGGGPAALGQGLAGAGIALALLLPLFYVRWLGGGDVKLAVAFGAWLGPVAAFWATAVGLAGGGLVAFGMFLVGGATLRAEVSTNLRNAALTWTVPKVAKRGRGQLVPMALALAGAAIGMYFAQGGPA